MAEVRKMKNFAAFYTLFEMHLHSAKITNFCAKNFVYKQNDFHSFLTQPATLQAAKQRSQRQHIKHPQSELDNSNTDQMAQLPPEDIATLPAHKVVFNAPFDNKATYYMRIINPGTKRIGYAFKTTKPKRINMNPPNGVLGPKDSVNVAISCDAFDPSAEDTKSDRVTVEWTNTPDAEATAFKLEWFQGDGMVRRKNLPIEYNV